MCLVDKYLLKSAKKSSVPVILYVQRVLIIMSRVAILNPVPKHLCAATLTFLFVI